MNHKFELREVLRDFVFGMEDGLVSNLGLVLGVYMGSGDSFAIILAGLASMFTGAFSMSAGSYLAAKSQREVYEEEMKDAQQELEKNPKGHLKEMCTQLRKEGFDRDEVGIICKHYIRHNQRTYRESYVQKKVGIARNKLELPMRNAIMMFFSFLLGSSFPILPFILAKENIAVIIAPIVTIIMLFVVGVFKTHYTKRSPIASGLQVVLVGLGAGIIGYIVGLVLSMMG